MPSTAHAPVIILTALPHELAAADAPAGVEVVYCGVGKVNAALHATRIILERQPALIINFGTAGKIDPRHDGLLEVAAVVQRDMLAMPLAARGVTPLMPAAEQPARLESGYPGVVCGTGDSFVSSADEWLHRQRIDLVDMELFAIARACRHFGVPWRAFKFITDGADEGAADDWETRVHLGAELFWRHLPQVIAR